MKLKLELIVTSRLGNIILELQLRDTRLERESILDRNPTQSITVTAMGAVNGEGVRVLKSAYLPRAANVSIVSLPSLLKAQGHRRNGHVTPFTSIVRDQVVLTNFIIDDYKDCRTLKPPDLSFLQRPP